MGNHLTSWRATIGQFHSKSCGFLKRFSFNMSFSPALLQMLDILFRHLYIATKITYFLLMCDAANIHFLFVIHILLHISGDVESNSGPDLPIQDNCARVLSLLRLNIRSIRHKLSYIFETLSDHHMLCFTETHLDNQVTDTHLLSECLNYTLHRRDLTAHSGGVIVYVSNGLFCRRRLDLVLPSVA